MRRSRLPARLTVGMAALVLISAFAADAWANTLFAYPFELFFGPTSVTQTSGPLTVALINLNDGTITLGPISVAGAFTETNDCGPLLQTHAFCRVKVTYAPTRVGPSIGNLVIYYQEANRQRVQLVGLRGLGVRGPSSTLNPTALPDRD